MPPCVPVFGLLALAAAAFPSGPDAEKSPLPYPHPLITEVLYGVPSGKAGDANGDGDRQPLGDEFVELINPFDRPINLKGYTIVDADAYSPGAPKPTKPAPGGKPDNKPADPKNAEIRFTFPDCELKPGQIAVLFNGYKSTFSGPVGNQSQAPSGPNPAYHNALVFSMFNTSPYAAFGNDGDFVLLIGPDGKPVQGITWGKAAKNIPMDCLVREEAPIAVGSVQRTSLGGKLVAHTDLGGDFKGSPCSPGLFAAAPVDPAAVPSFSPRPPDAGSGTGAPSIGGKPGASPGGTKPAKPGR